MLVNPAALAPTRPLRAVLFVSCLLAVAVGSAIARWEAQLSSDHRGFYLVSVADSFQPTPEDIRARPRRTFVVVFDGLGFEEASTMPAMNLLRSRGQCLKTHVGSFSVSRPVYAALSTGLEQDRTGARSNAIETPLAAESIWQIARQAGL